MSSSTDQNNPESYFHDPIHGHMAFSKVEKAVIDTVEFQRLRFIRQLSLMHYVFPGSFHTRFAHSLGVCHVARRICVQLFSEASSSQNYVCQVFRLASLLHDVGHGAFSHSLTHIQVEGTSFIPSFRNLIEKADAWGLDTISSQNVLKSIVKLSEKDEPTEHEVFSVLIIHRIFEVIASENKSILGDVTVSDWQQDISEILIGGSGVSQTFLEAAQELLQNDCDLIEIDETLPDKPMQLAKALHHLVAGTIDADRMDYLLRDSFNCGVSYGHFDLDGMISSMRLVTFNGKLKTAIEAKRANTLDDFLWSRFQMFRQIYCHKTHNAYNLLLEESFEDLLKAGELQRPNSLNDYLSLTDDLVMSKVFLLAQSASAEASWTKAFARRKLPQFLGVFEAAVSDRVWEGDPFEIFNNLEESKSTPAEEEVVSICLKTEVLKGKESEIPLLVDYNKTNKKWHIKSLLSKSVFFNSDLIEEKRLDELKRRLNRKLMFFYRHRAQ